MEENKNTFTYTYSAKGQAEIQKIRNKYLPSEPDTVEKLRILDRGATRRSLIPSLILGIIGTLLFGAGMSCIMVFSQKIPDIAFIAGIIMGIIGIVGASVAYPVYKRRLKTERSRIAPEIIRLSDEFVK